MNGSFTSIAFCCLAVKSLVKTRCDGFSTQQHEASRTKERLSLPAPARGGGSFSGAEVRRLGRRTSAPVMFLRSRQESGVRGGERSSIRKACIKQSEIREASCSHTKPASAAYS